jgi:hypothetical protein
MRIILALALSLFATLATAADYTATIGTPLHASVRYGFDDTVSITPAVSGTYSIDVVPSTVYGGCSTRYCRSKWSIVTTLTAANVGDVSLLPNGNASIPMTAGTTYVLHIAGVGTGTGIYAGYGAYTVNVAKQ